MHIFVINDKGKKIKSRALEFFLFTDLLCYAKPVTGRNKRLSYVVYKLVHRSRVQIRRARDSNNKHIAAVYKDDDRMMEMLIFGEDTVQPLCIRANNDMEWCVLLPHVLPRVLRI